MKRSALIIGSGPAGLSCAVYLLRAGFKVSVLEKERFSGGQLLNTDKIENYLGFESVSGFDLAKKFRGHAQAAGAEFKIGEVCALKTGEVTLKSGEKLSADAVLVAVGALPKRLGAAGEAEFSGRGVSYCAVCDGAFFRGKDAAVIGGGDTALTDALYLSAVCKSVTVIHRREELRGAWVLQEAVRSKENITLCLNEQVEKFVGNKTLEGIVLKSGKELSVSGAFIAIGQKPATDFLPCEILNRDGYVVTDEGLKTALDGVWAAGDVREKTVRQIITAAADGAVAADSIVKAIKA